LYDPIAHGSLVHQVGFDPYLSLQGDLGLVLFCLGFPDQGLERCTAAIGLARKSGHSPSWQSAWPLGL